MAAGKSSSLSEIASALNGARRVLVLSHFNPDPDAIGSTCGVMLGLRALGKEVVAINQTKVNPWFYYIPGAKEVGCEIPKGEFDTLVALDCGDISRFGDAFRAALEKHPRIVNIDHHYSNSLFGVLNWVDDQASSTCEMVYKLLLELKIKANRDMASALLTGIMADTGSFRFRSTSASTFRVAAELIDCGAVAQEVADPLFHSRSRVSVAFRSHLVTDIHYYYEGKLAEVVAPRELIERFKVEDGDMEGVIDEVRCIEGVIVSLFIRKDVEIWRVSMRSKSANVDVSKVAALFGGGGHKAAAAFRSKKELEEFRPKLIEAIGNELKNLPLT